MLIRILCAVFCLHREPSARENRLSYLRRLAKGQKVGLYQSDVDYTRRMGIER